MEWNGEDFRLRVARLEAEDSDGDDGSIDSMKQMLNNEIAVVTHAYWARNGMGRVSDSELRGWRPKTQIETIAA